MEYQFCREPGGQPEVHFSMNHEALGNWLMHELGTNTTKINQLIVIVQSLMNRERWRYEQEGQEFHLALTRDQAKVTAALLATDMACDDMEDMDYYDNESISDCGLDDFLILLESWRDYLLS